MDPRPPITHGYARVSTGGQSLDAQIETLTATGVERLWQETMSGARTDRVRLRAMLDALTPGDVVVVTRLDRLARSTRDLLNVLAEIAEAGAAFRSLSDAWADTTTSHGRLMLTVLGGLAEFERDLIRTRTSEGRARAVARGVRMGRRPKLTAHQRREALARKAAGESVREIARSYAVSHSTISRLKPNLKSRRSRHDPCAASAATPRATAAAARRRSRVHRVVPGVSRQAVSRAQSTYPMPRPCSARRSIAIRTSDPVATAVRGSRPEATARRPGRAAIRARSRR